VSNRYEGILFDRKPYWSENINGWVHVYRAFRGNKLIVLAETQTKCDQGFNKFLVTGAPQISPGYLEGKPDVQTSSDISGR
jgi:hypothetical protein